MKLTYSKYYPEGFEVRKFQRSRELVHGMGNNDAPYVVRPKVNGKRVRCPAFVKWKSMLTRAYCPKYQARRQTYVGTQVYRGWLESFMTFRSWFFTGLSKTNLQPGEAQVDKDILSDRKFYSPETCILIPGSLNRLLTDSGATRGDLPQGVCRNGSGYRADVNSLETKRQIYLGTYKTVPEAFNVYVKRKSEVIKSAPIPYWLDEDKIRRRLLTIFRRQMRTQRIEFAHLL